MKYVLIVEDDEVKANGLSAFMQEAHEVEKIVVAKSLTSGLRAALRGDMDLILLDMSMTNFDRSLNEDGGRPHAFAGREILRQLQREEVNVPVVIVTQFDQFGSEDEAVTLSELVSDLESRFSAYMGTVYYRSNVDDWKGQLNDIISSL